RPDIVILDVVMPVKNGIEAAKEITGLDLPSVIVMCTSLGYEPIVEEAIRSGASGYIIKPLNAEKVLSTLAGIPGLL
ncbi:MAG TPA: response regulator, partial [Thermodesulfobacteriota bacterium]|nr:response regulator [Thermodesulfobacteriota bacterium]